MTDPVLETLMLPFANGTLDVPAEGQILFLRARAGAPLDALPKERMVCEQSFAPEAEGLRRAGFELTEKAEGTFPLVLVVPPRQRQETRTLYARAVAAAGAGGLVISCVSNAEGAKTAEADLKALAGSVTSISKNKCRVFWADISPEATDASLLEAWKELDAPRPIEDGRFTSRPGIFSWEHIDPASALLAANLPETLAGRGADLGAGYGVLAVEVLRKAPRVVSLALYEAEKRALDLAASNVAREAGQRTVNFHWADVTKGVQGPFDFIVMNPPFHQGSKAGRTDVGQAFIRSAARALRTGGVLWMVANRHLPYEKLLNEMFGTIDMIADERGYKVIRAVKGGKARKAEGEFDDEA